ncbi:MAG: lasso peptide biosynthesis B2 protein [Bacteroidetes bacterium]|nr:lasso peptide biosynthesis B2 protein [Bacteroidota bacterium]
MIKRFQQLRELSIKDWKVLTLSLFFLPSIAISLHIIGYKKTKSVLSYFMPPEKASQRAKDMGEVHSMARTIHIAARHNIFKANCLKQALLLWFLLGRKSIYSEIKFGVSTISTSKFNAHAWVVCNGETLIDSEDTINTFSAF